MSDLSSYLAANYLTADPPKTKKRKRKQAKGLLIKDDDETGWGSKTDAADDDDGDLEPVTASGTTADFRRKQTSNWKTIGGPAAKAQTSDADAAAADAIIASAAAENAAAAKADDEALVVEGSVDIDSDDGVEKMGDGTHAGLQSGASVSAQMEKQRRREREAWEREERSKDGVREEQAYRDATGRRVDISLRRAEARRAAAEAEDAEKKAKDALKGNVQLEEARRRREQLSEARNMAFARTADDDEINRELKERKRWNDPMAQFLSEKNAEGTGKSGTRRVKGRPTYTGPAPPNRYGIQPGYRWDGVDRGNGFEAERFRALNRTERNKGLEYAWQLDD